MEIRTHRSIDVKATGLNIYRLRVSRGYSVGDIQRYFGFAAPQAIYKWENGQTLPSTDNLYDLSHLFGIPMEAILVPRKYVVGSQPRDSSCGSGFFGKTALAGEAAFRFRQRSGGLNQGSGSLNQLSAA